MRSDVALDGSDSGSRLLKAAVATGLAALCTVVAAAGAAESAQRRSAAGRAASAGPQAGLAAAGGGRGGVAVLPPVRRLCFHGLRGEPVDFPAVLDCP